MPDPSSPPCVFVVADPGRIGELLDALAEPLPTAAASGIEILPSSGGDDTIDLFEARKPHVVVVTATLDTGDASALVSALRDMVPRAELGVVLIGDADGPVRTERDAADLLPDRFVARPVVPRTLRFAVASTLEAVLLVRRELPTAGSGTAPGTDPALPTPPAPADSIEASRAAQRARWEALADSIVQDAIEVDDDDLGVDEPVPLPPPVTIMPRRAETGRPMPIAPPPPEAWREPAAPAREPTLILRDPPDPAAPAPIAAVDDDLRTARTDTREPAVSRTRTGDERVDLTERVAPGDAWSEPVPLAELLDRDSRRDLEPAAAAGDADADVLDDLDEPPVRISDPYLGSATDLAAFVAGRAAGWGGNGEPASEPPPDEPAPPPDGRDFARQLRAKMSVMAQRLFQGAEVVGPGSVDLAPRHDHHTEIDLASLGEELPLGGGVTEIEARVAHRAVEPHAATTSPGSWDTQQVRERGLPEAGELVRGVSDAPCLIAKMFGGGLTGRVAFRRDAVEKIVHFDNGRPVFAASNERGDRMGELLVREGKITAAQYERCQDVVAQSGRRMGEILVDFGYLKRRELLPAVRRHVEDLVYSVFGWDRGHYAITIDPEPCGERIRLSRHPAALILEGIRRKLDRATLDRLVGPASTVVEVSDRERLGAVINTGDLAPEERAALAAFDGQADLAQVARVAGIEIADILPLAWGLCVLGLATARRADTEVPDESTALVGETDLAIDRERVRARWQLVTEADYFALLGVRRDATGFEIRRAYQAARRDFAVESFPADLRRELAQELDDIQHVLDEAFRVLRDDRLRNRYLANLID